jgi:Condensation domain/AMP-binding enzyme
MAARLRQRPGDFPLSSVQRVVWFDHITHPGIPLCNIGIACEIDGALDPAILEAAINQIVEVNEAPRLVLSSGDGMPRQRVLPAVHVALAVHDFSRHADAAERAHEHMRQAFREPFTSLSELLWDTQLLIVSPERCYWLHRYHHIVADGLGVTLFTHACIAAYNRLLKGVGNPPPAVPSYLDFVEEDESYLYSPRFNRDAAFWGERYAMVPAPLFQRAVIRQLGLASPSDQVRWTIARAHFNQLTAFAAGHGYSIAHLLIAALSVYFSRVSGADEVIIGLPVHNRTSAKLKAMFGMFSSVSPIGIAVDSGADFVQLMGVVATELRRCYRHQRYPISELNRSLKLAQQGRRQLFDIALSYETLDAVARFGTCAFKVIAMDNGYEQTPLAIFVRDYYPEDEVTIDFNFNTSVLRRDEVQRIRKSIELLLHSVVPHATLQVGRLPLIDEQERQELLLTRNDTSVDFPQTHRLHDFFEEQARACPDAIAVEFESDQFTYQQLNRSANQLAYYLISRGVRPDAPVAICMDRSIGMVVGLMGILKAGGAYVPLDPSYPVERLAFMLRDCAPVTVLAQRTWVELVSPVNVPVLLLDEKGWAPELSRQPSMSPRRNSSAT